MDSDPRSTKLHVHGPSPKVVSPSAQSLPEGQIRHCPYCYENISPYARKCWRCHEYFSPSPDEIDDRVLQFARREVLQDVVFDIKKWITRIGFGSVFGLLLVAMLGGLRFQDVLEDMVSDRVELAMNPLVKTAETKLGETDEVLNEVEDSVRLAQYRINQFDTLNEKLDIADGQVQKVEKARLSLETKAVELADHFDQLEHRFINAKRELRNDRERRLEEMLGNFSNQVVTFNKLYDMLASVGTPESQQLMARLEPMRFRQINLVTPFTLASDHPAVVFSSLVRMEWRFEGYDLGEVTYRVHFDVQRDFASSHAGQETTRLAKLDLPAAFPHGPVYWRVEAMGRDGQVMATSDVGHFEFYENSIDRIRSTGVIRVGVACSVEGEFAYFDSASGRLTGFDIELSRWLAARLLPEETELRPVFIGYNWNGLFDSVRRSEVDFIISTITITPHREEEYGLKFSRPYYKTFQACVVVQESRIRSPAQLQGSRIAVQEGTTSETVGEAFTEPTNLHRVSSPEVAFDELLRGQIDAVITDYDFAQSQVRNLKVPATVIPLRENDFPASYSGVRSEDYGIAVSKPEIELLERLNATIEQAARQGVLEGYKRDFITGARGPVVRRAVPTPELATPTPRHHREEHATLR